MDNLCGDPEGRGLRGRVVAGDGAGAGGCAAGHGADDGGHRADVGRAGVPVQPVAVGPVVGAAGGARGWAEVRGPFDPDALLYYWPYARHGINFHPPLAGQLDLLTYALFGHWVKDIPAAAGVGLRVCADDCAGVRLPARRYGAWVGGIMAVVLLLMPRVYGDGHIAGTDMPGLLLWAATALAFWKGLYEPGARRWRVAVGVLMGLAFVEKMAAVLVLLPLLAWLVAARLPRSLRSREGRADRIDGLLTSLVLLAPLGVAFLEVLRLSARFPPPDHTNLFRDRPASGLPGAILAVPSLVWLGRRLLERAFPRHPVWGVERPALETWTSILAFAPLVGWLGNPAWWRETLPRLAHYYMLSTDRQSAPARHPHPLHGPDVCVQPPLAQRLGPDRDHCAGEPPGSRPGGPVLHSPERPARPAPALFPAPPGDLADPPDAAHSRPRRRPPVPTHVLLPRRAGRLGNRLARRLRLRRMRLRADVLRTVLALLVFGPAAWQLIKVHPFELSYYNELIGGPKGAWHRGFELAYWYDAFNGRTLADLNAKLPRGAMLAFLNERTEMTPTFSELQSLGELRCDLVLGCAPEPVPLRVALDPGFEGLAADPPALCHEALVCGSSPGSSTRGGWRRSLIPGRIAGLGPGATGRRGRFPSGRAPGDQRGDLRVGAFRSARSPRGGASHRERRSEAERPRRASPPGNPSRQRPVQASPRPLFAAPPERPAGRPGRGGRDPDPAPRRRPGRADPCRLYRPDTIGGFLDRDLPGR